MGTTELTVPAQEHSIFQNLAKFEQAVRMARLLAQSSLVPKDFRGSIENCTIALELADRLRTSPLMVMQHIAVVNGKPGWDAQFITGKINSCGRYEPLRYEFSGEGEHYGCAAWTREIGSDVKLIGPKVDWKMVHAEKWDKKDGSKWLTLSEVMFGYRAASFWGKRYCPELLLGMHSIDELEDITPTSPRVKDMGAAEVVDPTAEALNDMLTPSGPSGDHEATQATQTPGPNATASPAPDGKGGGVYDKGPRDPQFELAKILRGCEIADNPADLQALERLAQSLPDAEKAEALGTIAQRREELNTALTDKKGSADGLFA